MEPKFKLSYLRLSMRLELGELCVTQFGFSVLVGFMIHRAIQSIENGYSKDSSIIKIQDILITMVRELHLQMSM